MHSVLFLVLYGSVVYRINVEKKEECRLTFRAFIAGTEDDPPGNLQSSLVAKALNEPRRSDMMKLPYSMRCT